MSRNGGFVMKLWPQAWGGGGGGIRRCDWVICGALQYFTTGLKNSYVVLFHAPYMCGAEAE